MIPEATDKDAHTQYSMKIIKLLDKYKKDLSFAFFILVIIIYAKFPELEDHLDDDLIGRSFSERRAKLSGLEEHDPRSIHRAQKQEFYILRMAMTMTDSQPSLKLKVKLGKNVYQKVLQSVSQDNFLKLLNSQLGALVRMITPQENVSKADKIVNIMLMEVVFARVALSGLQAIIKSSMSGDTERNVLACFVQSFLQEFKTRQQEDNEDLRLYYCCCYNALVSSFWTIFAILQPKYGIYFDLYIYIFQL